MSSGEIWYFLREQESVGPFSKEALEQIHEGGQLPPETLVWREGMETWQPASSVAELDIPKKTPARPSLRLPTGPPIGLKSPSSSAHSPAIEEPATVPSEPGSSASPQEDSKPKPKLKLKSIAPEEPKPVSESKGEASSKPQQAHNEGTTVEDKRTIPNSFQRLCSKVFSSLIMLPLFLLLSGGMIYLYQDHFPNVLWFVWITVLLSGFGVLMLFGIHGLNGTFRLFCFLLLVPPLTLIWPAIMADQPWSTITIAEWVYLGFCVLYCLTARIGANNFIPAGMGTLAGFTGILTLAFIGTVARSDLPQQYLDGWDTLLHKGSQVRLPGIIARAINKPEWGTEIGAVQMIADKKESRHGIESATFKAMEDKRYRFVIQTLDGLYYAALISNLEGGFSLKKITKKNWPVFFNKEGLEDVAADGAHQTTVNDIKGEAGTATLRIDKMEDDKWSGVIEIQFISAPGAKAIPVTGTFETKVQNFLRSQD